MPADPPVHVHVVPGADERRAVGVEALVGLECVLGAIGLPSSSKLTPEYIGTGCGAHIATAEPGTAQLRAPRQQRFARAWNRASPLPIRHDCSAGMLRSGG